MEKIMYASRSTPNNSCGAIILSSIKTKGNNQTILQDAFLCEGQRG
ncbi:hypothetical protein Goshw_000553 [Gossypium schwendimanii]|uniref:Uncharacterized protein n=1 Tax=Gossypium schwendimanii TaxID=34291 RepID=A0A7J9N636_GOSSC|nr:hypothetical protein [Gossypium schwendimanii]